MEKDIGIMPTNLMPMCGSEFQELRPTISLSRNIQILLSILALKNSIK